MILKKARELLIEEGNALKKMAEHLDAEFEKAVRILLKTEGKIVVIGIGKSGLIGRKIAATLSSTGSPSIFMHAAEGLHGDIGVIDGRDTVIILSYSGTTEEIAMVIAYVNRLNTPVVLVTGNRDSELAKNCAAVIEIKIDREACPMNLVPTTSTTAMLAVGDALAVCLLDEKGFKPEDFASLHPGGTLGKKLLLKVDDIIKRTGGNPVVSSGSTVKDALIEMTRTRIGATSVVDDKGCIIGYFTDGDLRRHLQEDPDIINKQIDSVMTSDPRKISSGSLAIEAREILKKYNFDNIPVVDPDGKPVGVIDERDIIREGL
ncbi:MAG: KpsF/GutQ family sugar-phosphate isomerase [Elusimicrobiota bacterium]